MPRKLTVEQRDALDQQDKENNWGRWEIVGYTKRGRPRYKWQNQLLAAEKSSEILLRDGHLSRGRFQQ